MSVQVEPITEPMVLGEGPHWDDRSQALYFVCIHGQTIHKYKLDTQVHTKTKVDGRVSFIIPVEKTMDQFVVGIERKFLVIQWDGEDGSPVKLLRELGEVDQSAPKNRMNDGKADPRGKLFAGTMGYEEPLGNYELGKGSLFRVDTSGVKQMISGVGISNGLAWDEREGAFYYTDSLEGNIRRYDYDVDTGEISNLKYIFDFDKINTKGFPDGMTTDSEGNLWVAVFGGSCVLKIDPKTGELLLKIPIPAEQVTSVAFGGPDLDILFVTTASMPIGGVKQPPSGATFKVIGLGVRGCRSNNVKL